MSDNVVVVSGGIWSFTHILPCLSSTTSGHMDHGMRGSVEHSHTVLSTAALLKWTIDCFN